MVRAAANTIDASHKQQFFVTQYLPHTYKHSLASYNLGRASSTTGSLLRSTPLAAWPPAVQCTHQSPLASAPAHTRHTVVLQVVHGVGCVAYGTQVVRLQSSLMRLSSCISPCASASRSLVPITCRFSSKQPLPHGSHMCREASRHTSRCAHGWNTQASAAKQAICSRTRRQLTSRRSLYHQSTTYLQRVCGVDTILFTEQDYLCGR